MNTLHYRPHLTRSLDGSWEFAWLGADIDLREEALESVAAAAEYAGTLSVPGCFDCMPGYEGARGTAAIRTTFETSGEAAGVIAFDGLGIWAAIVIDGRLVATHAKPYSPFSVHLPSGVAGTSGVHELVVLLDNRFDSRRSPLQENYFDFYAYGGIFRPVGYTPLPPAYLSDIAVRTISTRPAAIEVHMVLGGEMVESTPTFAVDGEEATATETSARAEDGSQRPDDRTRTFTLEIDGAAARLWSPAEPAMHRLTVRLGRDECTVPFGIRTVEARDGEVLLNGDPIRLFGWNRHEVHPQFGPALPLAQLEHDIRLMKRAGANFVRGSHYPQDDRFLDLCDQHGVMVWEESIGWQQKREHFTNPSYQRLINEQQAEMIRAHFNHPAIIMWGFQNELHSDEPESRAAVEALARTTRTADPYRPITFASMKFPHDICLDLVDIVSLNTYPGWYASEADEYRPIGEIEERLVYLIAGLKEQGLADKPFIVSEIGAGAIYGWRDPQGSHWSEEYQADHLEEVCRQFLARTEITGLALWQFSDGRTYGSARALSRPRSFNNKGVVDEYRRPKRAYDRVRKLMSRFRDSE